VSPLLSFQPSRWQILHRQHSKATCYRRNEDLIVVLLFLFIECRVLFTGSGIWCKDGNVLYKQTGQCAHDPGLKIRGFHHESPSSLPVTRSHLSKVYPPFYQTNAKKTHQTFKVLPFTLFLTYLHVTPVRRRCEARKNTNIQSDLEPSSKWQNHQANPVFPRSVIKRGQVLENTTKPSFLSLHELPDPCCGLATVPILGSFNRTRLNCYTSSSVQCPHIEKLPSPPGHPLWDVYCVLLESECHINVMYLYLLSNRE